MSKTVDEDIKVGDQFVYRKCPTVFTVVYIHGRNVVMSWGSYNKNLDIVHKNIMKHSWARLTHDVDMSNEMETSG